MSDTKEDEGRTSNLRVQYNHVEGVAFWRLIALLLLPLILNTKFRHGRRIWSYVSIIIASALSPEPILRSDVPRVGARAEIVTDGRERRSHPVGIFLPLLVFIDGYEKYR